MSDTLQRGAERLAKEVRCSVHQPSVNMVHFRAVDAIAADPGICALVEHCEWCEMHGTDDETANRALDALKLWEHGDA